MKTQKNRIKQKLSYVLFRSLKATFPSQTFKNLPFNSPEMIENWIDASLNEMDNELATVLLPLLLDRLQQIVIYGESENE